MNSDGSRLIPALVFSALFAYVILRRIRRNIGRQRIRPRAIGFRLVLLLGVCALLMFSPAMTRAGVLDSVVAAFLGALLALVSLRFSHVEHTVDGDFYTPHRLIGLAIIALLVGRVLYRLYPMLSGGGTDFTAGTPGSIPIRSPLTFAFVFLVAGYYLCYLTGVLLRVRQLATGGPVMPQSPQ